MSKKVNKRSKARRKFAVVWALSARESKEATADAGYRGGTFRGSDLGQHRQGYCRAGSWATQTSGDMLDYGQSLTWIEQFDDGVYMESSRHEAEAHDGFVVSDLSEEYVADAEGVFHSAYSDEPDYSVVYGAEERLSLIEETNGRTLATGVTIGSNLVDWEDAPRKRVVREDEQKHERRLLNLNGANEWEMVEAVYQFASASFPAFVRFAEAMDELAKAGMDVSKPRKAIEAAIKADAIVLDSEQEEELRKRLARRPSETLAALVPALS